MHERYYVELAKQEKLLSPLCESRSYKRYDSAHLEI